MYICGNEGNVVRFCQNKKYIMFLSFITQDFGSNSTIESHSLSVLVDSVASVSLVDVLAFIEVAHSDIKACHFKIYNANGTVFQFLGLISITLVIKGKTFTHDFVLCKNLIKKCILGMDLMLRYNCILDF